MSDVQVPAVAGSESEVQKIVHAVEAVPGEVLHAAEHAAEAAVRDVELLAKDVLAHIEALFRSQPNSQTHSLLERLKARVEQVL